MMNKKYILPFTLTGLVSALAACGGGGESATIFEDPNKGVVTTTNGCSDSSEKCLAFYVDYPVEGLNFDCSTDTKNHFITEMDSGLASGGCAVGDKASFYIQGTQTSRKISLGVVDLTKIRQLKVTGQPAAIGLIDIATAMTGKAPTQMNMSDDTFKVMVGLVRVMQAVGTAQDASVEGDVQPIELTNELKNNLSKIASDVDVKNFLDGSYVNILQPWLNIGAIDQQAAEKVAVQLINLSDVGLYTANFLAIKQGSVDLGGFFGTTTSGSGIESIANLYALTNRQGFSTGYAVQWMGKPVTTGENIISTIGRINLLTQSVPNKLNAQGTSNWINSFTKKIGTPFVLQSPSNIADRLEIYQGALLNGTTIPGTEFMYKQITGDTKAPTDSSVYGRWRQSAGNEQLTGSIDIYKTNPATYLDKQVFSTINNVKSGEKYIFPLYANLTFKFSDSSVSDVKLGIVVDENGDIRTNIGRNATVNDMSSAECVSVDDSTYKDTNGVQQYRVGTTGAANFGVRDKSLTIRMILANPAFGNIDGALIGLNESLMFLPQDSSGKITSYSSGGVRLNLQNLIVGNVSAGINITGWDGAAATNAEWGNLLAMSQVVYNSVKDNEKKVTAEQKELAKRTSGIITIDLPSCYTVKTK